MSDLFPRQPPQRLALENVCSNSALSFTEAGPLDHPGRTPFWATPDGAGTAFRLTETCAKMSQFCKTLNRSVVSCQESVGLRPSVSGLC